MEINNAIRKQVVADLKAGLVDEDETGESIIATFFNGNPRYIAVPEFEAEENDTDIPAISVSVSEGQCVEESRKVCFSEAQRQALVRAMRR